MFASSSRVALRAARAGKAPAFSTSAAANGKTKNVVVELLNNVPGLGLKFDRVSVSPLRMNSELIPFRLARFIPWKRGVDKPQPFLQQTSPRAAPNDQRQLHAPGEGSAPSTRVHADPTPEDLLNKLHLLPSSLQFARRTISPTTPALHGSLTLSEVQDAVAQHGLSGAEVEVVWAGQDAGARMKELGTWDALVSVRGFGGEEVPVGVEVVRLE